MILFKYTKTGSAAYISHLDMIRHIGRTLRRAKIAVNQSEGFNKHSRIFLSPPIGVGLESVCEYCTVETNFNAAEFRKLFNAHAPEGVSCVYAVNVDKNPNVSGIARAAEYKLVVEGDFDPALITDKTEILVADRKGNQKDVRGKILQIRANGSIVTAVLSFGNDNLRADVFCGILEEICGIKVKTIVKNKVFADNLTDIDVTYSV